MFPGLDGMVGYNHAKEIAEVEKTCAALAAACEDKTEDGHKKYIELHREAIKKHGDIAIAREMKKYRKPRKQPNC